MTEPLAKSPQPSGAGLPPLAPEFIDALLDHAMSTLQDWLCLNAPPSLFILADRINWLHYYQLRRQKGDNHGLDSEVAEMVWETINAIAEAGGGFYCPSGQIRRKSSNARESENKHEAQ
jgi:hypothetical protein